MVNVTIYSIHGSYGTLLCRISGEFLNGKRLLTKLQTLALGNQDQYRLTSWCTIRDRQNATAPICEFNTRFGPGFHFSSHAEGFAGAPNNMQHIQFWTTLSSMWLVWL